MTSQNKPASLWPSPEGNDTRLAFARNIVSRLEQENMEIDGFIECLLSALADMADVSKQPGEAVRARHAGGTVRRAKDA